MGMIRVRVSDISGSRSREVEAPDDVSVDRIVVLLVEKMNLPLTAPDGQLMSYKLHDRRSGRQLLDSETFHEAGIAHLSELRLQAEITAGGPRSREVIGPEAPLTLNEGRFARLESIEWWDRARVETARVLVVGAGALGNEVVKNLALLGVRHVVVSDMDRVEVSNLSRSVLLRESDRNEPKAICVARAARDLYPLLDIRPIVGSIQAELGMGYVRWADVVIGAVDNREARIFLNRVCALAGRPWIDGGIEVLHGIVRGFAPPETACYECTMSTRDWDLVNQRRSCSLLAQRAFESRGAPTTPTMASIIAALQVQEAVKLLHDLDPLLGRGLLFDGARHDSYVVSYPIDPTCDWHEAPAPIETAADLHSGTTLEAVWARAEVLLGSVDALHCSRDLVLSLICPSCSETCDAFAPPDRIPERLLHCDACGEERVPEMLRSLTAGDRMLKRTVRAIGLPCWDVMWAQRGDEVIGIELTGDDPFAKGAAN